MHNVMASAMEHPRLATSARPDVSVIIVSWNTRDLLQECLQSLRDHSGPVRMEVIIVDNCSADDSVAMVRQGFPDIRLICNERNRGFAAANNQGMAVARGRYMLLLNSDTRVLDGAIAKAVAFADRHPQAGLVGCRTRVPDGGLQFNCYRLPNLVNLAISLSHLNLVFPNSRFFGQRRMTWWDYDSSREVDGIAGCFMLARREAVEQVGPMAEDYFMYSEDTDWCWRFGQAGWTILYTPAATIIHRGRGSSDQCAADMHLLERRALLMLLERKDSRLTRRLANAMFLIGALARVPVVLVSMLTGRSDEIGISEQWARTKANIRFHLLGRLPHDLQQKLDEALDTSRRAAVGVRR